MSNDELEVVVAEGILMHWHGLPVEVTGAVRVHPGSLSIIRDAEQDLHDLGEG